MKRQEIKMKLLVSIERTKSKYEIMSNKVTELLNDLTISQKAFLDALYNPYSALKQAFLNITPTLVTDLKFQESIPEPNAHIESPLKDKQSAISHALQQIRKNYETLKKNHELMDIFAQDLGKTYEFTKENIVKLEEEILKFQERVSGLIKNSDDLKEEITSALIDHEYSQPGIIKLNNGVKLVEDQRADLEKIWVYLKDRLNAWKKHMTTIPNKHDKVQNHVVNSVKAMNILRKEAEKVSKLVQILIKPPEKQKPIGKIETSPLKELDEVLPKNNEKSPETSDVPKKDEQKSSENQQPINVMSKNEVKKEENIPKNEEIKKVEGNVIPDNKNETCEHHIKSNIPEEKKNIQPEEKKSENDEEKKPENKPLKEEKKTENLLDEAKKEEKKIPENPKSELNEKQENKPEIKKTEEKNDTKIMKIEEKKAEIKCPQNDENTEELENDLEENIDEPDL